MMHGPPLVAFMRHGRPTSLRHPQRVRIDDAPVEAARRRDRAQREAAQEEARAGYPFWSGWVAPNERLGLWAASAPANGRQAWLGYFRTQAQAEAAVKRFELLQNLERAARRTSMRRGRRP